MSASAWTTPEDVVQTLRRRWSRGGYLRSHARGEPWASVEVSINGPSADDVLGNPAEVVRWVDSWRRASLDRQGRSLFEIEWRTVRNRTLGENSIPKRIRLPGLRQLAQFLGVAADLRRLESQLDVTHRELPGAVAWVADHPIDAMANSDDWPRLVRTVRWIAEHDPRAFDLRHLDVPNVDTKFIERNRKVLGRLLDEVLPVSRIDPTSSDFAIRYGFRPRPRYVRLRVLSQIADLPQQLTEIEVRADELARLPLSVANVFIVENQASYLAFPDAPDAIVVFGAGFAVTTLELVPWLAERNVIYWGDIDTHGFAILDRLRQRVPEVRSMLMDHATLVAHLNQLTLEPSPTSVHLRHLTADEQTLYRDLVESRYGPAARLEQERVRFGLLRDALVATQQSAGDIVSG
ncbi:MAG: DUF3322 and DUF2220 domain-containing protein [Marmoricola sp.]